MVLPLAARLALVVLVGAATTTWAVRDETAPSKCATDRGAAADSAAAGAADRGSCDGLAFDVVAAVGVGAQGIVFHVELDDGRSAVAKVSPSYPGSLDNVEQEVQIDKKLDQVPRTLKYVAHCGSVKATKDMVAASSARYPKKAWIAGDLDMLILSPYVSNAKECYMQLGDEGCPFLDTEEKIRSALRQMFETMWAMLEAGVTNHDQAPQNIMFSQDGTPTFIDMGVALFISEVHPMLTVDFLRGIFNLIPPSAALVHWVEENLVQTRPELDQKLTDGRELADVIDTTWAAWKDTVLKAAAAGASAA